MMNSKYKIAWVRVVDHVHITPRKRSGLAHPALDAERSFIAPYYVNILSKNNSQLILF